MARKPANPKQRPQSPIYRNRIIERLEMDPNDLLQNPQNHRAHPSNQQRALSGAIDEIGYLDPVTVQQGTHTIIDGHLRVALAIRNGWNTIPVDVTDLDDQEVNKALLTFDAITALAINDKALFERNLRAAEFEDADLREMMGKMAADYGIVDLAGYRLADGTEDQVPRLGKGEPRTKRGDIWILGRHRLKCGDCTVLDDVVPAFAGATADLLLTDPPYGVEYVGKTRDALTIEGDDLGHAGTRDLVTDMLRTTRLRPGGAFYIFAPAGDHELDFRQGIHNAGWQLRQALVWVKQQFVMGRQDYHWRHETILYGWQAGAAHYFLADRTVDTVIDDEPDPDRMTKEQLLRLVERYRKGEAHSVIREDRPHQSTVHPTMKPVALLERLILNSSLPGETIADPFAGSGSTIIAAEKTGRTAIAMELDPAYCDVIIERWQDYAKQSAYRFSAGTEATAAD